MSPTQKLLSGALVSLSIHAASAQVRIIDIGVRSNITSESARSLSPDGTRVVGDRPPTADTPSQGFIWSESTGFVYLGEVSAQGYARPYQMTNAGVVMAGGVLLSSDVPPWIWNPATGWSTAPVYPNYHAPKFRSMASNGRFVGTALSATNVERSYAYLGPSNFRLAPVGYSFSDIAADGSRVGYRDNPRAACHWDTLEHLTVFPEIRDVAAVSDDGRVLIGTNTASNIHFQRAIFDGSTWSVQDLGPSAPHDYALPAACSADGSVIVGTQFVASDPFPGAYFACIWTQETGLVLLSNYLSARGADVDGYYFSACVDVSADGRSFLVRGSDFTTNTYFLIHLPPPCSTADFNNDGDSGTDADIEAFFACLAGNCCPTCWRLGPDFNGDGDSGTDADIESFFRVLAGGSC